jgi:biotin/lipoyl-binding protein
MVDNNAVPAPLNNSNGDSQPVMLAPPSRDRRPQTTSNPATSTVPNRQRHRRSVIIAAVLVFVSAAGLYFYLQFANSSGKKGGPPPVMISAATASSGNIGVYVQALGTVTPVYTVSLTARVSGQITKVEYREGQLVHSGDPLLEIVYLCFDRLRIWWENRRERAAVSSQPAFGLTDAT